MRDLVVRVRDVLTSLYSSVVGVVVFSFFRKCRFGPRVRDGRSDEKIIFIECSFFFWVCFLLGHRLQRLSTEPADVDGDTVRSHLTTPCLRVYYLYFEPNVDLKTFSSNTLCGACV